MSRGTDEYTAVLVDGSTKPLVDPRYRRGYIAGWYDARERARERLWSWLLAFVFVTTLLWFPVSLFVLGRLLDMDLAEMGGWVFGGVIACWWVLVLVWGSGDYVHKRDRKRRMVEEAKLDQECREAAAAQRRAANDARLAAEAVTADRKAAKADRKAAKAEDRRILGLLDDAWPAVLADVRVYSRVTWIMLDQSFPLSVKGGVVTVALRFRDSGMANRLSDSKQRELLRRAILDVTGEDMAVEVEGAAVDVDSTPAVVPVAGGR
jgi:hypothetical protein